MTRRTSPIAPAANSPLPTPLRDSTRRFLRPLLGIDPAEARIYRGPLAEQVAASYGADAVASGDSLALAAGNTEDTPATVGLLAHELLHVARARAPRFVPPIAPAARPLPGLPADEEQLAAAAEQAGLQAAHTQPNRDQVPPRPHPLEPAEPPSRPDQPNAPATAWGSLPAPWEPLPQWLTDSPAAAPSPSAALRSPPAPAPAAAPSRAQAAPPAAQPQPAPVWRAETSRATPVPPVSDEAAPVAPALPPPDLDDLARQVYTMLKRRLADEMRRRR